MTELFEKSEKTLSSIYEVMKMSIQQTDTEVSKEYLDSLTEASQHSLDFMKDVVEALKEDKLRLSQSCIEKINEFYNVAKTLPKTESEVLEGKVILEKYNSLIQSALPIAMITNSLLKPEKWFILDLKRIYKSRLNFFESENT